jgi:FAD/FMN-containing dehydrogenase
VRPDNRPARPVHPDAPPARHPADSRATDPARTPIDRRDFLRLAGVTAIVGLVEGCTRRTQNPSRTPSPGASTAATSTGPAAIATQSAVTSSAAASTPAGPEIADLDALATSLGDRLLRPSDRGYLTAARLFSTRFDAVRPEAVARCASVDDVQRCLEFVRATRTPIAARSGGHSYAGYSTTSGLVIDVGPMKSVGPGASADTARIGAGATLLDVYVGLAAVNRGLPGGSCPTVGITGSTLGGGVGVVARKYGLSCDALTALELVTVDGKFLRCSESNEPDLFWAHRGGGGGNFGVVTALEFRTHETRSLTRFLVRWDWAKAHDVVTAWQRWSPAAPDELWSSLHIDGAGSASDQPHVFVSGVYIGAPAALQPLLDDMRAAVNATMTTRFVKEDGYLQTMFAEGGCADLSAAACHRADTEPAGKLGREANAARSDFIAEPLPPAGVDVLLAAIDSRGKLRLPGGSVLFDAYGGAINAVAPTDTAFVHRDKLACLQYVASWAPNAQQAVVDANQAWLDELYAAMRPYVSGFAYLNYIDAKLDDWQHAYYGGNLDRLIRVKAAADPANLLGFPQGLPTRLPAP